MKNANTTSAATLAALAASVIAGSPSAQQQAGGVAVMEPPPAPTAAPTVAKPRNRRGTNKANAAPAPTAPQTTGDVSVELSDTPVDTGAGKDDLGLQPGTRSILKAIGTTKVGRGSKISKKERTAVHAACLDMLMGLGLGETNQVNDESVGFGPLTRIVCIHLVKDLLQKVDPKITTVQVSHLNETNLRSVLSMPNLAKVGNDKLDLYLAKLATTAATKGRVISSATAKTRVRNEKLARKFLSSGVAAEMITALDKIVELGKEVRYGQVRLPLDRAIGVALGRSIGASELFKTDSREIVKAGE